MTATDGPSAAIPRPLHEIADDIRRNWPKVYFGAEPYINAMRYLSTLDDIYIHEPARDIVTRFLSNAATWRGDDARRVKAELNAMLGR